MDDEAETYKLWRIRKTVMQASIRVNVFSQPSDLYQRLIIVKFRIPSSYSIACTVTAMSRPRIPSNAR